MKRIALCILAVLLAALVLTACEKAESTPSSPSELPSITPAPISATPAPTPEPTPTLPPYEPNILTGAARDADYAVNQRPLAVMINNITQARPQTGTSQADILVEIEVEGGITRLMGIFQDYKALGEIGPIRSARIQYFELLAPWGMIYVHDGENEATVTPMVRALEYGEWNLKNPAFAYRHRDRRNWAGKTVDYEHTEYFTGEKLAKYIESNKVDDFRDYSTGTFFRFVDYRQENPVRDLTNSIDSYYTTKYGPVVQDGESLAIIHNENQQFRTRFFYDSATNAYNMEQWYTSVYGGDNTWKPTIDEGSKTQLSFTNVVVLFTQIDDYPNTKSVKRVDYLSGGTGYYFYGGKSERIYWEKGNAGDYLWLYYLDDEGNKSDTMLELNIGKTYLSVVDLDCYDYFAENSLPSANAGNNG